MEEEKKVKEENLGVRIAVENIEATKLKMEKLEPILVSVDEEKNTMTVTRDYKSLELAESDLRIISIVYNNMIKKHCTENNNINIR